LTAITSHKVQEINLLLTSLLQRRCISPLPYVQQQQQDYLKQLMALGVAYLMRRVGGNWQQHNQK